MKVERVKQEFKTVDLFAGPGGLAEGFSAFRDARGQKVFDIAFSVEKESSAFATLRLRSFFRQFAKAPDAYYDYIAGRISKASLVSAYPDEWQRAELETAMLELGTDEAREEIDKRLEDIIALTGNNTVVIGGPPCQAYSLVGRARNQGVKGYVASEDHRHFLYREYIRILERLRPAAFVMENVKGILSSKIGGEHIIDQVLADLRAAGGGDDSYRLVPIVDDDRGTLPGHMIRSENFGIPQCRHRVILVGLRRDIAETWERSGKPWPRLAPAVRQAKVAHVLAGIFMPVSRRMHPAVCDYISAAVYEGKLHSDDAAASQSLLAPDGRSLVGAGVRAVEHFGRSQVSPEEIDAIKAQIDAVTGATYRARDGSERVIDHTDILVVAPYNAQVNSLRAALPSAVRVGTVDRFQGQEAPVCLVSMTTSSGEELPRDIDFLFSLNRINVAVSRAQTSAVVFASPLLLETPCRTVEEMMLVNALCLLREHGGDSF